MRRPGAFAMNDARPTPVDADTRTRLILHLRSVALVEAVSFLLLLGIAMPLKYLAGLPMAVKIVGWAHGLLFVWLLIALAIVKLRARWTWREAGVVLLAALLPFGPFVIDRRLREAARAG
jgi:integral membrane protein